METSNITLRRLKTFLKSLENKFALKNHTHMVDSELSEESANTVQNKAIAVEIGNLKRENTQQSTEMMDIKMLGWSVPRDCPIQNEIQSNQFIRKVDRVDLGNLYWTIADNNKGFVSFDHTVIKSHGNMFCYKYGNGRDKTWSDNNIGCENKTIWIADTNYSDASAFKIAMQGVYLYYELATPVTTTIDGNEIILNGDTVLTGKLNAEETVLTLKSKKISKDSIIDVYADTYGLAPTSIVQSENSIILTFKPQSSDANIKVVIR